MNELTIRPAKEKDYPEICALLSENRLPVNGVTKHFENYVSLITPKNRGILLRRAVILASHDPCFMFGEMPIANTVMQDSNARSLSPGHTPIKQRMRLLKRFYI